MPENKIEIRSEAVQDILTQVPHWMILWGNTLILVLIIGFLSLSWSIKYPDLIASEATITTTIPPQKEVSKITGVIDSILVEDTQSVKINDPLALIRNGANLSDVLFLKEVISKVNIERDSFHFPIEEIPYLTLGEINKSYTLFESNYVNYVLHKDLSPYKAAVSVSQLTGSEIQNRISTLEDQKKLDQKALTLSKSKLKRNQELYEKGVISLQEYEEKEVAYLKEEQQFKTLDLSISQLKQAKGDAYRATQESRINNQMESIRLYRNAVRSFLELKENIKNWEEKYVLKSNLNGMVSFMGIQNKNQNISAGDWLFTVIPNEKEAFIAKLKTPATNFGKVKLGQIVQIKLNDYPETEFGMLKGRVKSMSAISNEEGYYFIDVSLPDELITSFGHTINFKAEMTGHAEIITEDLRLMERFFYQLKGIFN